MKFWHLTWREDAHHVVGVFTDEPGQSYMNPEITQAHLVEWADAADDLSIYAFSKLSQQNGVFGWDPVCHDGSWSQLTANTPSMFDELMQIIDEEACGGGDEEEEQGAFLTPVTPLLNPIDKARVLDGDTRYILATTGRCLGSCLWSFKGGQQPPSSPSPNKTPQQSAPYFLPYSWKEQVCLSGWP